MITIDSRIGSGELEPCFKPYSVPVSVGKLDFGDLCWWGLGPDGPCMIGVERKRINDFVQSMRSNRLSGHQLPGLLREYSWVYLVIEGRFSIGKTGALEVWRRGGWGPLYVGARPVLFTELDHYCATLEHVCGLTVTRMFNEKETVAYCVSRYNWWQKDWDSHKSHEQVYAPYEAIQRRGNRVLLSRRTPSLREKVAAQLPGVGRSAMDIADQFKSTKEMVGAGVSRWAELSIVTRGKKTGRKKQKFGAKRAKRVVDAMGEG